MGVNIRRQVITGALINEDDFKKISTTSTKFEEEVFEEQKPHIQSKSVNRFINLDPYNDSGNHPGFIIGIVIKELVGDGWNAGDEDSFLIENIDDIYIELTSQEIEKIKQVEIEIKEILREEKLDFIKIKTYKVEYFC